MRLTAWTPSNLLVMSQPDPHEHRVALLSELDPAPSMRPFEIGEVKGLLVRLREGLHAVSDVCPHAKAPLHEGALCGHRLVCPWHHSVFDVGSGALLEPPALDGLARYPVRMEGDAVFVTLPDADAPTALAVVAAKGRRTVLVVGAGAAGQVAVETLRREGFDGRVILAGPEPEPPYDRTNLSKHFLSGQTKREDLPLRRDPGFFDRIGVERRVAAVERLDARGKTAVLTDGEIVSYDAAILATGGTPKRLDVPGAADPRVCLLRTVDDAERVLALLPEKGARAVAVGASFIGMEAVSSLAQRGVNVTVLSPDELPFTRQLGPEIGASIRRLHERNGVRFVPGAKVARFEGASGGELTVRLEDGGSIAADVAIIGVGVRPTTDFVQGVERERDGGIVVDRRLHAGHDLYAVGDVASFPLPGQVGSGERVRIEHWRVAQQHGALAAWNIARSEKRRDLDTSGFVPFFWTFHFGQRMNYVGHARAWDEVIFDGDPNEPPFVAYYLRGGKTVAAVGTHRDADLAAMHELLRLDRAPTAAQLRSGNYSPLREVAAAP